MKMLSLIMVIFIFSTGHSYADSLEDKNGDQVARPPHERVVLGEYEKLMNGEAPIDIMLPTDLYGMAVNDAKVLDQERIPGKVGRAPAVVGEAIIKDYKDPSIVEKK